MAKLPAQDIVERLTARSAECATASASDDKDRFMNVVAKFTRADGVLMTEAADTISRLTADNEALRSALEAERAAMDVTQRRAISAESRADALAQEVESLKAEKECLQGVLQAAHDALKRDIPAKAFHAVRAAIRALANEEAGR